MRLVDGRHRNEVIQLAAAHLDTGYWPSILSETLEGLLRKQAIQTLDEVARLMDEGKGQMEASLVKLYACRAAEFITREAMQIHGGMGYAEETAVSRYFVDARVLSIFEGAEETVAIKVVARDLLGDAR